MLTQRLGFENQKKEEYIKELVKLIKRNPGSCDEVWLATDYGYPTLDKQLESAKLLGNSAKILREAGVRVSLQLSNTLGHGDYMGVRDCSGLIYEGSPAEKFVDVDGIEAGYSFCWYGDHFRKYLVETIKIYCREVQPYRVWIDDDFRYDNHGPSGRGCMCNRCLKRFNDYYHSNFDRTSLAAAVRNDNKWRRCFADFIRDGICNTAKLIARTVTAVSPDSSIGYQHGAGGLPADEDFAEIFRALRAESGKTVGTRPGAGTYNDHNPSDMLRKLDCIRYQNSLCEGDVDEIRPEIENFPHVCFGKSPAGTCYETSLYLAGGADSMSYASMMYDFEPLSWHEEFFSDFSRHRCYWEKLSYLSKTTYECGITHYLPDDIWKRDLEAGEHSYAWTEVPWHTGNDIQRCGIPVSFRKNSKNPIYMLTAEVAACMSDDDIEYLAGKPVFCGGDALSCLCRKGYGSFFSASAELCDTLLLYEVYTEHKINGDAAGKRWENGLMQRSGSYLTDINGETEVLGYYGTDGLAARKICDNDKYPFGISSAIVKTSKGAEWYVSGQYPWISVISWNKRRQIINALDLISEARLPVISTGRHQVVLLPRETAEGKTASVSVLNTTVGAANGITLEIRRPVCESAAAYLPNGSSSLLSSMMKNGNLIITLPSVAPWDLCTVVLEKQ